VFGLLIIGHEFGHFITAKLSNIKVNEFSFGMGPRILKFGRGETEYSWRAFPIGGFVKMLGEEEQVNDPRSFSTKPTPVKMAVIASGPLMNIIISILIFASIAVSIGYVRPVVKDYVVSEQSGIIYPAKTAGILPGDRIVRANDVKIYTYSDFQMLMYQNGKNPVDLTINRQGKVVTIRNIVPVKDPVEERYLIGIVPDSGKAGFFEGIQYGALSTWSFANQIAGFFKGLIIGQSSTEDVSGPVGIIKYAGDAARQGFDSLLIFTAFLSINLAIMNLIPFPALDGGWLLILLIEGIRRKKLDANKVGVINFVGFAFLMILTVLITFRDFIRLNIF
jgi:regulator of sigma E protease